MVHLYIGDGKGKTTASLGLALRARGQGRRVYIGQFLKDSKFSSGEIKAARAAKLKIDRFKGQIHPMFIKGQAPSRKTIKQSLAKSLDRVEGYLEKKRFDLVVLDELLGALDAKLLTLARLKRIINKAEDIELVLTGQRAPAPIMELADYISFIVNLKHPFDAGCPARCGVEY